MWIIQNSWGTSSDDHGFFYVRFQDVGTNSGQFNIQSPVGLAVSQNGNLVSTLSGPSSSWSPPSQFNWATSGKFGNSSVTCASRPLNQNQCGSCYAIASSAVFATTLCVATGNKNFLYFSPQATLNLQYLKTGQDPCSGGCPFVTLGYLASNINSALPTCGKNCAEGCLPYTEGSCLEPSGGPDKSAANTASPHRRTGDGAATGQRVRVDLNTSHADTVLKSFFRKWQEKLAHPEQHRVHRVYSLTRQVTNGLLYRIRLQMAVQWQRGVSRALYCALRPGRGRSNRLVAAALQHRSARLKLPSVVACIVQ